MTCVVQCAHIWNVAARAPYKLSLGLPSCVPECMHIQVLRLCKAEKLLCGQL
jgi:hypothetical protein